MAEAHYDIRPAPRHSDQRRKVGAKRCDFDGLIQERHFQSKRGRLQREALARAPDPHPVIVVGLLREEDGDA